MEHLFGSFWLILGHYGSFWFRLIFNKRLYQLFFTGLRYGNIYIS